MGKAGPDPAVWRFASSRAGVCVGGRKLTGETFSQRSWKDLGTRVSFAAMVVACGHVVENSCCKSATASGRMYFNGRERVSSSRGLSWKRRRRRCEAGLPLSRRSEADVAVQKGVDRCLGIDCDTCARWAFVRLVDLWPGRCAVVGG
jgi:hypothetical protein